MQINTNTPLKLEDELPLTCTRIGTCCHGNQVLLNPYELFRIAREKNVTAEFFRDNFCDLGGIRIAFNGKSDSRGKKACSQYVEDFGCNVHLGRPLACRLFPIGRQVQNNKIEYVHEGETFPCLNGCSEVLNLPRLTVGDYLSGQLTSGYEIAQNQYLEVMQNLADLAFELLLDSGLAESGDRKTLKMWREMSVDQPENLVKRIGTEWYDSLTIPLMTESVDSSALFVQKHSELLQLKIQGSFSKLKSINDFHNASVLIMGMTIHLARSLGAKPEDLTIHWIDTAKKYGAKE